MSKHIIPFLLLRVACTACLVLLGATPSVAFEHPIVNDRYLETRRTRLCSNYSDEDCLSTPSVSSRRNALAKLLASAGMIVVASADPAAAATPITLGESEGLGAMAERAMRPKPPKVLRPKLDRDFAILLMRSSYNALDQIDCVAMDQFQRDFFFIRKAEYEPYTKLLGPGLVQQGELTDPYYFDFISFAQYATISREVSKNPPSVFEEQQPMEVPEGEPQKFISKLVRRDPSLTNDMLPARHSSLVGAAILNRLEEVFGGTKAGIPKIVPGSRPDAETLLASLSQMVKLFLVNGFAFDGSTSIVSLGSEANGASGTQFCVTLTSPANLWSGKALQLRHASTANDFVLKAARELLQRAGYTVSKSTVKYEGNEEKTFFTVR